MVEDVVKINIINEILLIRERKYIRKKIKEEYNKTSFNELLSSEYYDEYYFKRLIDIEQELNKIYAKTIHF